ncbi:MAG: leucine-rich repeat protein [Chitinispirillales bacterium]|nr:leucine-rich repeat protein [Chitinispirillales bacterium]
MKLNFSLVKAFAAAAALFMFSGCDRGGFNGNNISVEYTLTVEWYPVTGGTVTPESQSGITEETPVNITAAAAGGYRFVNWTLTSGHALFDDANDANTIVTLGWNATIRANFELHEVIPTCGSDGHGHFNDDIEYGSFVDDRDDRCYRTVQIGEQTWMAENLHYAGADGNLGACYDNDPAHCDTYGRLYDWSAVMNGASSSSSNPSGVRGICPAGWHVPGRDEWSALISFVGSLSGTQLKSASGWNNGNNGTDVHGFSALPGGGRRADGSFENAGSFGYWWSTTENSSTVSALGRYVGESTEMGMGWYNKAIGFPLRCVQSEAPIFTRSWNAGIGADSAAVIATFNDGTLTVSGTGPMINFWSAPAGILWNEVRDSIINVVIEDGVTSIGNAAFYGHANLTSVTIPSSVTSIGMSTFQGCTGLTSVTLPSSVTSIGLSAFWGCTGLTSIIALSPDPIPIEYWEIFQRVDKTNVCLYVPEGSIDAYKSANIWGEFECIMAVD